MPPVATRNPNNTWHLQPPPVEFHDLQRTPSVDSAATIRTSCTSGYNSSNGGHSELSVALRARPASNSKTSVQHVHAFAPPAATLACPAPPCKAGSGIRPHSPAPATGHALPATLGTSGPACMPPRHQWLRVHASSPSMTRTTRAVLQAPLRLDSSPNSRPGALRAYGPFKPGCANGVSGTVTPAVAKVV